MVSDYEIYKQGDVLTLEQVGVLKLLWDAQSGGFQQLDSDLPESTPESEKE